MIPDTPPAVIAPDPAAEAQGVPSDPNDPRVIGLHAGLNAGLDPVLWGAQLHQESRFDPNAISSAGAVGLAQVMPATFADVAARRFPGEKLDINNPADNAKVGATYMREQMDHYGGDVEKALSAYNHGPGNTDRLIAQLGSDWKRGLPKETADYIPAITKYLPGGVSAPQPAVTGQPDEAGPAPSSQVATNLAGELFNVEPGGEAEAAHQGLRILDPEEARQKTAERDYGGPVGRTMAGAESILSGITGGGSELAEKALGISPESILGRREAFPVQNQVLEGLGLGLPLGEISAATKGASLATKMGTQAIGWGLSGAAHEATDELLNDHPLVGEAIAEAGGLNALVGAGAELGLWGLGKAVDATGVRTALGSTMAIRDAYIKASSMVTGQPKEIVGNLFADAVEAANVGGYQKLYEGRVRDLGGSAAEAIQGLIEQTHDLARDGRTAVLNRVDAELGANDSTYTAGTEDQTIKGTPERTVRDADGNVETIPEVPDRVIKGTPATVSSPVKAEAFERIRQARVRLGIDAAGGTGGGATTGAEWDAVRRDYRAEQARALARGESMPDIFDGKGANERSSAIARALDTAEQRLKDGTTEAKDWLAMHGATSSIDDLTDYNKLASGNAEPGAYKSNDSARDVAGLFRDFTKDENIFPTFGAEFRDWQAAQAGWIGARQDLMGYAGAKVEGGAREISKLKIADAWKKAYLDNEAIGAQYLENFIAKSAELGDAAEKLNPGGSAKSIPGSALDIAAAQMEAMRALGMKDAAAKLGGAGSGGLSIGRIGLGAYLAHRALGTPYGIGLGVALGWKALTQPAGVALTKARLATMLGKLGARINPGAASSVASLLRGAVSGAARGEASEAAREYIQRDIMTGRKHDSFEDGAIAHRNFVVSSPDLTRTLQRSTGRLASEHQAAVAINTAQKLSVLKAAAPLSSSIGGDEIPPTRAALLAYADIAWAVEHPIDALKEQWASGHPRPEIMNAIKDSSPNLFARFQAAAGAEVHKQWPDEQVPIRVHQAIARANGGDIGGVPGAFGAHMQAAYTLASTPPQQAGGQGVQQPRKSRKGDFKWGESLTLPSHSSMV